MSSVPPPGTYPLKVPPRPDFDNDKVRDENRRMLAQMSSEIERLKHPWWQGLPPSPLQLRPKHSEVSWIQYQKLFKIQYVKYSRFYKIDYSNHTHYYE